MICQYCKLNIKTGFHHQYNPDKKECYDIHTASGQLNITAYNVGYLKKLTGQDWLRKEFQDLQEQMIKIMLAKNSDYSNGNRPFSNFEQIELLSGNQISREEATLVRMSDKMSRAFRLLKHEPQVLGEKLEDTLIDLANYSLLLIIMLKEKADASNSSK